MCIARIILIPAHGKPYRLSEHDVLNVVLMCNIIFFLFFVHSP